MAQQKKRSMKLDNSVIWITGASSGIGKELALQLSALHCKLILSGRRENTLLEVKKMCKTPEDVVILPFNLEKHELIPSIVKKALSFYNTIDKIILNGGISQRSLIIDTDLAVDKKLIDVDYLGNVAISKAILPYFVENKKGHFVVVSSVMGKFGSPYRSGYCGAKHALHGFFDVLRMEHDKDCVKVTMICPGFVNTNVSRNALTGDGSPLNKQDSGTENGLPVTVFTKKMIQAIKKETYEVYIGKSEIKGVYMKRFFPKLLHRLVLKSKVR